jgi:hypothetical protein
VYVYLYRCVVVVVKKIVYLWGVLFIYIFVREVENDTLRWIIDIYIIYIIY